MDLKERQSLLGIQIMKFKDALQTYGFTNKWFLLALFVVVAWSFALIVMKCF
jgi:hypothetical protein